MNKIKENSTNLGDDVYVSFDMNRRSATLQKDKDGVIQEITFTEECLFEFLCYILDIAVKVVDSFDREKL